MHSPRIPHLDAINRILRYLKGTLGKGIWMKKITLMLYVVIPIQIGHKALIENQLPAFAYLWTEI
jgi:hypothetical protein